MDITKLKTWMKEIIAGCYNETGFLPSLEDWMGNIESEEFVETFGTWDLATIINLLVQCEGVR